MFIYYPRGIEVRAPLHLSTTLISLCRAFGTTQIPTEKILPVLKLAFDHSLQEVRTEALAISTELHRWLGDSILATIEEWDLRPAQKKELEQLFKNNNAKGSKPNQPMTPDKRVRANSVPPSPAYNTATPPSPSAIRRSQERIATTDSTPRKPSPDRSAASDELSCSPPSISPTSFDAFVDSNDAQPFEVNSDTEESDEEHAASADNSQRPENPTKADAPLPPLEQTNPEPISIPPRTFPDRDDPGYSSVNILSTLNKAWYLEMVRIGKYWLLYSLFSLSLRLKVNGKKENCG